MDCRDDNAQVTLKPIELSTLNRLTVNADAADGEVRVELLTAEGYRVADFTRERSIAITGDSLQHPVKWKGKTIVNLAPGRYQLRVHLSNAKLFALTVER